MRDCLIVTLSIAWWGHCIGGRHYTGRLTGYIAPGKYASKDVEQKLTPRRATEMNRYDGHRTYRTGEMSGRYDTRAQVRSAAIRQWKQHFPLAIVLNEGDHCFGDPQPVLVGPEWFKDATNDMAAQWKKLGGYEGNHDGCNALFHQYQALLERFYAESTTPPLENDTTTH